MRTTRRVRGATQPAVEAAKLHRLEMTDAEAVLWDVLRGRRLGGLRFRRQHTVGPYILDFWCSELRLVEEVDGPIHDHQIDYDEARTAHLEAYGYTVVRFRNDEVLSNLDAVLNRILATANTLRHRQPTPPLPGLGEGAAKRGAG
jgi:very-short-patch-repair endonuclease